MSKSISIIYTGGTVGMEPTERGLQPATLEEFSRLFHRLPELKNGTLPNFDLQASTPILDSASMKPHDWIRLAADVANKYAYYDGFLLVTGTDTMSYIASALSFFLENISKPVIITGSQSPLKNRDSDAPANLVGALKVLEQADGFFEVAIFFNGKVIRGNRAVKVSSREVNGIISPRFPIIGQLGDGVLNLRRDLILTEPREPFHLTNIRGDLPGISFLRVFPGLNPDILVCALREPVQGLILETYGSGTAPDDPEFLLPLERASSRGVVIVNTTQCLDGMVEMERYKVGRALSDIGVIGGGDMTTAAAHTKLLHLLSCGYSIPEVRHCISVNLRGELTSK